MGRRPGDAQLDEAREIIGDPANDNLTPDDVRRLEELAEEREQEIEDSRP